jgi:hypothetical protein
MRQMIKCTLAVAMCLAVLVPPAWGRCKDYGEAHPTGDGIGDNAVASAPTETLVVVWQSVAGIPVPVIIAVPVVSSTSNESDLADAPGQETEQEEGR